MNKFLGFYSSLKHLVEARRAQYTDCATVRVTENGGWFWARQEIFLFCSVSQCLDQLEPTVRSVSHGVKWQKSSSHLRGFSSVFFFFRTLIPPFCIMFVLCCQNMHCRVSLYETQTLCATFYICTYQLWMMQSVHSLCQWLVQTTWSDCVHTYKMAKCLSANLCSMCVGYAVNALVTFVCYNFFLLLSLTNFSLFSTYLVRLSSTPSLLPVLCNKCWRL